MDNELAMLATTGSDERRHNSTASFSVGKSVITGNTEVKISEFDTDEEYQMPFDRFLELNESGLWEGEVEEILWNLGAGKKYYGGGGASPIWTIERV